jgi:glycosyltransferase involved in cell wall biosynthesis
MQNLPALVALANFESSEFRYFASCYNQYTCEILDSRESIARILGRVVAENFKSVAITGDCPCELIIELTSSLKKQYGTSDIIVYATHSACIKTLAQLNCCTICVPSNALVNDALCHGSSPDYIKKQVALTNSNSNRLEVNKDIEILLPVCAEQLASPNNLEILRNLAFCVLFEAEKLSLKFVFENRDCEELFRKCFVDICSSAQVALHTCTNFDLFCDQFTSCHAVALPCDDSKSRQFICWLEACKNNKLIFSPFCPRTEDFSTNLVLLDCNFKPAISIEKQIRNHASNNLTSREIIKVNSLATSKPLKILFQNRPNADTHPGGDTVVMNSLARELRKLGCDVQIDHSLQAKQSEYDLVHLFNFAIPHVLEKYAKKAYEANVPFIVTSLCEDLPNFFSQCNAFGRHLVDYVARGQTADSFFWSKEREASLIKTNKFENDWVAKNASLLLSCGESETKVLKNSYQKTSLIKEVYFGFNQDCVGDANRFKQKHGLSSYILCVGRLEYRKNQLALLKALENDEHTIVLVGGGVEYFPEYVDAVRNFKRKGQTLILNRISEQELADAYAGASVHCLPSWYELPGLVSLEAAYHGCQIVATKFGACSDYLSDKALYCHPSDLASIREGVLTAYATPVNKNELINCVAKFTWENCATQVLEAYTQVLNSIQIPSSTVAIASSQADSDELVKVLSDADRAAQQGNFNLAENLLDKAIQIHPTNARAHRSKGAVLLAQAKPRDAIKYFEKALNIDPIDTRTLTGYGMCLFQTGSPDRAHDYFIRVAKLKEPDAILLHQLVQSSYALSRFTDLVEHLYNFLKKNKDNLEFRFCLAGSRG